ncbi:MAG: hypothetical protein WBB01_03955 [Phormidesmis sp.]
MKMMNMQAIGSSSEPDMPSRWRQLISVLTLLVGTVWLGSCAAQSAPEVRTITLQQQWAFNPGDEVSGNQVAGSLGDISLYLKEGQIQAPFDGELEASETDQCALYSTPEIPAYLFRLCGLQHFDYGDRKAGQTLGKGKYLSFATLRRQPDGTWIIVEPARGVLEKALD